MKVKEICCIGAGYVGGPTMSVIALKCPKIRVTVVDVNKEKIKAWNGPLDKLPIFEPGLSEVVKETRGRNLFFSNDIQKAIQKSEMIFMAVNTPTKTKGEGAGMAADLRHIISCTKDIAKYSKTNKIIIEKSTLPVRTAEKIKEILNSEGGDLKHEVLSNPEFMAEGTAIKDLFKSDRVLIGGDSTITGQKAMKKLIKIYINWIPKEKIITSNIWSSELSKLASNAMLAQRISSINSLSALCEKTGANIKDISLAVGMDKRIGPHFLKASVGFGGSCFQKDILNLVYLSNYYGLKEVAEYWHQVVKLNDYQKKRFSDNIIKNLDGSISNKTITILGWSFKPNTNDTRESPAIYVGINLLKKGAILKIYDPLVKKAQIIQDLNNLIKLDSDLKVKSSELISKVNVCLDIDSAINKTDAISIITDWADFKQIKWENIRKNKIPVFHILNNSNHNVYPDIN